MKRPNLLPRNLQSRKGRQLGWNFLRRSATAWIFLGSVACLGVAATWQGMELVATDQAVNQLKGQISDIRHSSSRSKKQLQDLNVELSKLQEEAEGLTAKRRLMAGARQPEVSVSRLLVEMAALVPDAIGLTKLSLTERGLKLEGNCQNAQAVANLMAQLDASSRFQDTTFGFTQRADKAGSSRFDFEITTKPVLRQGETP